MRHKSKRGMSKRGISTVVASILVLAITVALAVGLLTFGSSFMASQQKMQPPTTDQIKIEDVYFKPGGTEADVTVRNVGSGAVTLSNIYVNGQLADGVTGKAIAPGTAVMFPVTGTGISYSSGNTYTFKAATANGGENTYTATYTS
jgi:flagellin-like protein